MCRYKTGFPLSLVISQLSFISPQEAEQFLTEYDIAVFKPLPPAAVSIPAPAVDKTLQADVIAPRLVEALAKFTRADAKGQV